MACYVISPIVVKSLAVKPDPIRLLLFNNNNHLLEN